MIIQVYKMCKGEGGVKNAAAPFGWVFSLNKNTFRINSFWNYFGALKRLLLPTFLSYILQTYKPWRSIDKQCYFSSSGCFFIGTKHGFPSLEKPQQKGASYDELFRVWQCHPFTLYRKLAAGSHENHPTEKGKSNNLHKGKTHKGTLNNKALVYTLYSGYWVYHIPLLKGSNRGVKQLGALQPKNSSIFPMSSRGVWVN